MGGKILRRVKKDLAARVKRAKRVIFFLDYDGTLTPIRKKPALAKIDKSTKALLKKLAKNARSDVFIASGRSLKDIKKVVGLKGLYYIGNHGIELEGPQLRYINKSARSLKPLIQKAHKALKKKFPPGSEKFKGVIVENKTYTLSLHYRLADPKKIIIIKRNFTDVMKAFLKKKAAKITEGKKVLEVRPNIKWDKGRVINWVLERKKGKTLLPICIGDDKTDEDAFRALGKRGISILVSRKVRKTFARYRLGSPKEVIRFLDWVLKTRNPMLTHGE